MSPRRHILASHLCSRHILDGDRLELSLECDHRNGRPYVVASSGIVWGQFKNRQDAEQAFYDILLGNLNPLSARADLKSSKPQSLKLVRVTRPDEYETDPSLQDLYLGVTPKATLRA